MGNFNTSVVLFLFFLILSQAKAFNITTILGYYSSFSNFNNYLTQTGVAAAINSRQTITVLVVENNNLSPLKGKSQDVIANIMRVHVLLDYYDVQKLQNLPNKTVKVPTLFQTTGHAKKDQGFLNIADLGTGSISLGSSAKGETLGANLVKSIASQPYNISILEITNVIIPLGIDSSTSFPSPPRAPAPSPRNHNHNHSAPSHNHNHSAPSHTPTNRGPTPSLAPSPNRPSAAPAPGAAGTLPGGAGNVPGAAGNVPGGAGNVPAPEPAAAEETPAPAPYGSPPKPDAPAAEAPAADTPAADAPAPTSKNHDSSSASSVLGVSFILTAMLNLFHVVVILINGDS